MKTYYWETEEELGTNMDVMSWYLDNVNMLDIIKVDGTYAEGKNCNGDIYAIHASGDGSFFKHKIEFEKIN